jgi:hypothetical protein
MNEDPTIRGRSLTEACIVRSKNIIIAKAAFITNRQTQFLCSRIPPFLPSGNIIDELNKELNVRIDGYRLDIALDIKEIITLNNRKDILVDCKLEDQYHFSSVDLKNGYIEFFKKEMDKETNKYVLTDHISGVLVLNDTTPHLKIGSIYDFKKVMHHLKSLKNDSIQNSVAYIRSIKKIEENNGK